MMSPTQTSSSSAADIVDYVRHHLVDSREWHPLPGVPDIDLPAYLSLHALMLCIAAGLLLLLFMVFYKKEDRVPTGITNVLESMILFVRDQIAIANLGEEDGKRFTPLLCTLFLFILLLNYMGLVPLFVTATSNFSINLALAIIVLMVMIIGGMYKNGVVGFFACFIPPGLPLVIRPLVFTLEFAGIFIKTAVLMVRLYANMIAGHIIILSLLGLIVLFGWWISPPAIALALFIYLLELLVALIQAYIFTMLSAIFIAQIYHTEH